VNSHIPVGLLAGSSAKVVMTTPKGTVRVLRAIAEEPRFIRRSSVV
jgi:hypothetical protein